MEWVKLRVSLRFNRAFKRLSKNAKLAFVGALMAAADYEQGGALIMRQGALTAGELADDLMLPRRDAALAIAELLDAKFIEKDESGVLKIVKFREKTESRSASKMRAARERMKLESYKNDLDNLSQVGHIKGHNSGHSDLVGDAYIEREEEREKEPATQVTPLASPARQLGLVSDEERTAREILAALWKLVQPHVHGITRTEWGKRSKRYALDMAHAGVTVDSVLAAHASASQRIGAPVYSVRIIQDEINRTASGRPDAASGIRRI